MALERASALSLPNKILKIAMRALPRAAASSGTTGAGQSLTVLTTVKCSGVAEVSWTQHVLWHRAFTTAATAQSLVQRG